MKEFVCVNGHQFDMALTLGEEESEAEVCPVCKTDEFEKQWLDLELYNEHLRYHGS